MPIRIGDIEALFRYPVKSMGGERLDSVDLGWHCLEGDRRLGLHRLGDQGGFPWLTASRLPELVRYSPLWQGPGADGGLPTHVRTPTGELLETFGPELAAAITRRHGAPVQMMHMSRGIFDEASVSLIGSATVEETGRLAGQAPDVRRFRPNILLSTRAALPFEEDDWVGGTLSFGESADAPAIVITNRDERCGMVNIDPNSAALTGDLLKAIVRERKNLVGVYAAVARRGRLEAGQPVFFEPLGRR